MGTDTPLAVLSDRPRLLFDYFQQLFAQVTNPPLDAIREELVTALGSAIGPESNLLDPGPESCRQIMLPSPSSPTTSWRSSTTSRTPTSTTSAPGDLRACTRWPRAARACARPSNAVRAEASAGRSPTGVNILDPVRPRIRTPTMAPIPSLLLTAAVHHHLVREKTRTQVGLVVETGEAREVHHIACSSATARRRSTRTWRSRPIEDLRRRRWRRTDVTAEQAGHELHQGAGQGRPEGDVQDGHLDGRLLHRGPDLRGRSASATSWSTSTSPAPSAASAASASTQIAEEAQRRHRRAHAARPGPSGPTATLDVGGEYQWRREGEYHLFNPETVFKLQHATRTGQLRGLQGVHRRRQRPGRDSWPPCAGCSAAHRRAADRSRSTRSSRSRRSSSGSPPAPCRYGSISAEAHETLAIAMNRLGAKSNTGEGGEDPERFVPDANGDSRRSRSSRWPRAGSASPASTSSTPTTSRSRWPRAPSPARAASSRATRSTRGSPRPGTPRRASGSSRPPPHHDIYSIEDLAQLIHDLKNANPAARIHVKLVAEVGVGTVAAGVSKAQRRRGAHLRARRRYRAPRR